MIGSSWSSAARVSAWITYQQNVYRTSKKIKKLHPCGSDIISELQHRSLCRRNETRTVNLEEQFEKSAGAQSERTENPVGDTAGTVRKTAGMETFHNYYVPQYCAFIT